MEHKKHEKGNGIKFNLDDQNVIILLLVGLVVVGVAGVLIVSGRLGGPAQPQVPVVQLSTIVDSSCSDCFKIDSVLSSIKSSGVKVGSEETLEFSSPKAKELISKYGIQKIPTVIVTGDINASGLRKVFSQDGEERYGALVYTALTPVYLDAATGEAKGRISLVYLKDSSCTDCGDYSESIAQLKKIGMAITSEKNVEFDSAEGKAFTSKYNITNVPTLLLSKDASEYGEFEAVWKQIGSIESDGTHIIRTPNPPYRDIASGKIKGRVSIILLTDTSCAECYDPALHKTILERMGLKIVNESSVEYNSTQGKALVSKYNITASPTVLVSPDAVEYVVLLQVWPQVGTTESDGWFVFRNMQAMSGAVYRDLTTGSIVNATVAAPEAG